MNNLLYSKDDVKILNENIDKILEQVEELKIEKFGPSREESNTIFNVIRKFIKDNNRKIYGGTALDKLIRHKTNNKEYIYDEKNMSDIEFYSPTPIEDIIKLSNELHSLNIPYVHAREAQHNETFTLTANFKVYCDITYMPTNIYHTVPFIEIEGYKYIHPHFMMVDYMRMLSDPLLSYWRIEKSFKRYQLLQEHYPLPYSSENIDNRILETDEEINIVLDDIYKFFVENDNSFFIGLYAYNMFVLKVKDIMKLEKKHIDLCNINYYEIVSINYKEDCLKLYSILKQKYGDKISIEEYYPYFQFLGTSCNIYYSYDGSDENKVYICTIYDNYKRCIQYQKVDKQKFKVKDNKVINEKENGKVNIGTFNVTLKYLLMNIMKFRTEGKHMNEYKDMYYKLISYLIQLRQLYIQKTKTNLLTCDIFRDFIVDCKGITMTPLKEKTLSDEMKKKNKIQIFRFRYDPYISYKQPDEIKMFFCNSSGNLIRRSDNSVLFNDTCDVNNIKTMNKNINKAIESDLLETSEIDLNDSDNNSIISNSSSISNILDNYDNDSLFN